MIRLLKERMILIKIHGKRSKRRTVARVEIFYDWLGKACSGDVNEHGPVIISSNDSLL